MVVPQSGGALARRTANGVFVAVLALLFAQALVDAAAIDVGVTGDVNPFAAGPLVGATLFAGVGAAVAYAAAVRVTARPERTFLALATAVFVLLLGPVFLAPPAGITLVGQAILVVYHALVAVPLVAFILGLVEF
jgi:hypothetical protein